jgi:hypothetical protein
LIIKPFYVKITFQKEGIIMNRKITFKETVELFINTIIYDIVNEIETPRINFIFNDEAYNLFYKVMKNPFKLDKGIPYNVCSLLFISPPTLIF